MSSRIVAAALGGVPPEVTGSPTIQDVARLAKVSTATVEPGADPARAGRRADTPGGAGGDRADRLPRQPDGAQLAPPTGRGHRGAGAQSRQPVLLRRAGRHRGDRLAAGAQRADRRHAVSRMPATDGSAATWRKAGRTASSRWTAPCRTSSSPPAAKPTRRSSMPANGARARGCRRSASTMKAARRWPSSICSRSGTAASAIFWGRRTTCSRTPGGAASSGRCGRSAPSAAPRLVLRWRFLACRRSASRPCLAGTRPTAERGDRLVRHDGLRLHLGTAPAAGSTFPATSRSSASTTSNSSERFIPSLTTIHQPRSRIGGRAAQALIGLLAERRPERRRRTALLQATLVVRASTGAPPLGGQCVRLPLPRAVMRACGVDALEAVGAEEVALRLDQVRRCRGPGGSCRNRRAPTTAPAPAGRPRRRRGDDAAKRRMRLLHHGR